MARGKRWTKAEDDILLEFMEKGYKIKDIPKFADLNRSAESIKQRAYFFNVSKKQADEKARGMVRKKLKDNFSIGQRVMAITYTSSTGKHSPGVKQKGTVIGIYPHIARVKLDSKKCAECFNYTDLKILANKKGEER